MKSLISIAIFTLLTSVCFAQKVGLLLLPNASVSLKSKITETSISILLITPIKKGKNLFAPRYNFSNKSLGLLYERDFKSLGGYIIGMKSVRSRGGYIGVGVTRSADEKGSLFLEVGTPLGKFPKPSFSFGVLIPFLW